MRKRIATLLLLIVAFMGEIMGQEILCKQSVASRRAGRWSQTTNGLPVYEYTGKLPFKALDNYGKNSDLPDDPYFLLGNYKLTLFAHVSGIYQLMTAQRAWARINASSDRPNYGSCEATLTVDGQKHKLVGMNSLSADPQKTKRVFGTGFARYEYDLGNKMVCTRTLSVRPSEQVNQGNPSFLVSISLKNKGSRKTRFDYTETLPINYVPMGLQMTPVDLWAVSYASEIRVEADGQGASAKITTSAGRFLMKPQRQEHAMYDFYPPVVFMRAIEKDGMVGSSDPHSMCYTATVTLKPGESRTLHFVVGVADDAFSSHSQQTNHLMSGTRPDEADGAFSQLWKQHLPDLSQEQDEVMRREMLWNAYQIEASAKYSDYFHETFIPQGTVYSYHYGDNISNRDHLQAALGACYHNPALAKSSIRYVMKHSTADGEIKRGNTGFGYISPSIYKESDEQLYIFNTIAEYLKITNDYTFLDEEVELYPAEYGIRIKVIDLLKKYFIYLRDEVGRGPNGLVKLLNSDWADSFLHRYSPNVVEWSAESHLNTAMALVALPKLVDCLSQSGRKDIQSLSDAMTQLTAQLVADYMKDLGERRFSARAYLNDTLRFGTDNVCIEPQAYLLQNPTLSTERKRDIYAYVKSRIEAPERIGIRNRETALWDPHGGEDCGIWYSLEYPLLLGVATFDKDEAWRLLKKMSFDHFAHTYPNYWIGQWTAPDEINSTTYREGLYCFWIPINDYALGFQGYCSHPHTWPLFCYYKLKNNK